MESKKSFLSYCDRTALKYINGLLIEEEEGVRMSKFHFYYSVLSHGDLDKLVSFSLIISTSGKDFLTEF